MLLFSHSDTSHARARELMGKQIQNEFGLNSDVSKAAEDVVFFSTLNIQTEPLLGFT